MNKTEARQIAETITNQQLSDMFKKARSEIKGWAKRSKVNKSMTIGTAWNILAKDFYINHKYHILAKKNMIWEFGDFLPDELKPSKNIKKKLPKPHHQEPIFK